MSEFKRSPSKVWWANESLEWREVSGSPGSQDSGFSDTDVLNHPQEKNFESTPTKHTTLQNVPKEIFKEYSSPERSPNLSINYREKETPNKVFTKNLAYTDSKIHVTSNICDKNTYSDPVKKHRYMKKSSKVSKNLFDLKSDVIENQYSKNVPSISRSDVSFHNSFSGVKDVCSTQSLPIIEENIYHLPLGNNSAPEILLQEFQDEENASFNNSLVSNFKDEGTATSFNESLVSDCESELENLFSDPHEFPTHTSTPKTSVFPKMRHMGEKLPLNLFLRYQHERVPNFSNEKDIRNKAVLKWKTETRQVYEPECTSTLQCKSINGELTQKVSHLAARTSEKIRYIIKCYRCIENEYKHLKSDNISDVKDLANSIIGFVDTFDNQNDTLAKLYQEIQSTNEINSFKLITRLYAKFQAILNNLLFEEIKMLVDKLEHPSSDLELRATVTAVTSIALRNEELVTLFTKADVIPILLILSEKCEGSTIRSLILRALTTMCNNTNTVRQFEKYSGVQIIADTIAEDSRPEPERSEAVALLAQVTAPWIEDNNCVKGLKEYCKKLVRALTKFCASTNCCQNLLLSTAALVNLSSMDVTSINFILKENTIEVLLNAVKCRGTQVSVYLLEQVSTLIANMTGVEKTRTYLIDLNCPAVLLGFLQISRLDEDMEKRLQQKSMVALSRLCGDVHAAMQVVDIGGVEKLVKLCRDRKERHDSDAVLVAALATLRKIADACGAEVISAEDAQEFIEPKLLDSFLAYSNQSESYV